jgi:hypothetical protein
MAIEIEPPQPIPMKPAMRCFCLAASVNDGQAETWQLEKQLCQATNQEY